MRIKVRRQLFENPKIRSLYAVGHTFISPEQNSRAEQKFCDGHATDRRLTGFSAARVNSTRRDRRHGKYRVAGKSAGAPSSRAGVARIRIRAISVPGKAHGAVPSHTNLNTHRAPSERVCVSRETVGLVIFRRKTLHRRGSLFSTE